jgi:hypothetical protein
MLRPRSAAGAGEAWHKQKAEQAETGQAWKEWCQEQKSSRNSFPHETQVRYYTLIAKHPAAYKLPREAWHR